MLHQQIATVRQQLRLAESAGYLCAGLPGTSAVYILKDDTSECLHASNAEGIPADYPNPLNFEVIHRPLADNNDNSDLWCFNDLGTGKSVTSQANGRFLHASNTLVTGQGHKLLYTCAANNIDHAEEFSIVPFDTPDQFTFSGYFKLASVRTNLRATYGSDTTPESGGPRSIRTWIQRVQPLPLLISESPYQQVRGRDNALSPRDLTLI